MAQARELLQEALRHHQANDFSSAHKGYSQVLNSEPDNVDALNLMGLLCHQLRRHDIAFVMIARAIALKPDYAEAFNNLGNAQIGMNVLDGALVSFKRAVELKPDFGAAWFNLGEVLRKLGRFEEAIEPYRKAERLLPPNSLTPFHLSCVLEASGEAVEAEAAARRAVDLEPDSPNCWIVLGRALIRQDKQLEAAQCLEKALALQPDKVETLLETAGTFERWRMPDRAAEFYKLVLERDPEHDLALSRLLDMQLTLCDWRGYDAFCRRLVHRVEVEMANDAQVSIDVFNLHALPVSQDFTFRVAQHKARVIERQVADAKARSQFKFAPKRRDRIRVGYLLPYTTRQSMPLVLEPVVQRHDRTRFEL
ncbi:MAG TPA: tetratricopeptide repeat protein, partial [Candidatus Cybelea sp.]|nr:tetratricopeptide repeat protein [Candidatus Cybelea sp.]